MPELTVGELDALLQILDVSHFGRRQCAFRCDPQQRDLLARATSRVLLNCSRQSGKSTLAALKAVHTAVCRPGSTVIVTAPVKQQTREFIRKARHFGAISGRVKSAEKFSVQFRNGSRIVGIAADEDNVRGFSAVALVIVDEAARVQDEVFYALLPMLAVSDGALWILSTPKGKRGFFHQEWTRHPSHPGIAWVRFSVKAADCPRIPKEFLEQQKSLMGARLFAQEFDCLFVEVNHGVFDPEAVRKAFRGDIKPLDYGP
jgi:hypothetical protein